MAQVTAHTQAPDAAPLIASLSSPRAPERVVPSAGTQAAPVEAAPYTSSYRLRTSRSALAVDTVLSLALATLVTALGMLSAHVAVTVGAGWVLVSLAAGHYRQRALGESRSGRFRLVLGTGVRVAVLVLAASPWLTALDSVALAQLVAALSVASAVQLLLVVRRNRPRLVLAGRPRDVREAMLELRATDNHEIVAACLSRPCNRSLGDVPTYIGFDTSPGVASQHAADALVVLPGARLSPVELRRLHWTLAGHGVELCLGTGLLDVTPTRTRVFSTGGLDLVHVVPASLRGPRRLVKDVLERVAAAVWLVLLLPALLVIGLMVRLDSPGPALYRQARVGRYGRLFTMYKFRSMTCSADGERTQLISLNEADGVLFKIQRDPRVTRLGPWLRRWSIDEVPQLWNVVRGDMSLVGPRPALPEEVARYDVDPTRRLVVKPGLTGLWQVSGRSDLSWVESVRLDVRYVDNWSLGLDLQILLRTVRAVLCHRGAY